MWLPTAGVLNQNTGFLRPDPDLTITVPGTAKKAITVGAYNIWLDDYADFSGRGYMGAFASVKPELSAPGWILQQHWRAAVILWFQGHPLLCLL